MIFGTDTSKYQRPGTYDPGAFEIINAEDPTMPVKVRSNIADARPWGLYVWVYPGEHGQSMVNRAQAAVARAGAHPPLGVWWDYEDHGVAQWQLTEVFQAADAVGLWSGYYSNAGTVDHGEFAGRAYWLAAYPGNNDGSFPGLERMRPPRPVNIWQYSSTQGRLDVNVIVDEAWYAGLGGDTDMPLNNDDLEKIGNFLFVDKPFGFTRLEVAMKPTVDQFATWMQEQTTNVERHIDEKLAALPAGEGGSGIALTEEQITAIVEAVINKVKLST